MSKFFTVLRVAVSFGLLGFLFWIMRGEIKDVAVILAESDLRIIAAALLCIPGIPALLALRLKIIFAGEDLDPGFLRAFQLTLVGFFFNNFLPTAVGGDIVKGYYAGARTANKKMRAYASIFMDRLLGLYSYLLLALIAFILDSADTRPEAIAPVLLFFAIAGALGVIMAVNRKIAAFAGGFLKNIRLFRLGERLNSLYNIVHDYRNRGGIVLKALAVSVVSQSLYFFIIYLFFAALNAPVSMGKIFLIMPLVTFMSLMPSIGGLGIREGAMVALFLPLAGKQPAFAVSILLLFELIYISFMGGCVYLWWALTGSSAGSLSEKIAVKQA